MFLIMESDYWNEIFSFLIQAVSTLNLPIGTILAISFHHINFWYFLKISFSFMKMHSFWKYCLISFWCLFKMSSSTNISFISILVVFNAHIFRDFPIFLSTVSLLPLFYFHVHWLQWISAVILIFVPLYVTYYLFSGCL